jgi:hypothetical protein
MNIIDLFFLATSIILLMVYPLLPDRLIIDYIANPTKVDWKEDFVRPATILSFLISHLLLLTDLVFKVFNIIRIRAAST